MKLAYKFLLVAVFFSPQIKAQTNVKVLLEEASATKPACWIFESSSQFSISSPNQNNLNTSSDLQATPKKTRITKLVTGLKVEIKNNKIFVNHKRCRFNSIKLIPTSAPISVNGQFYAGAFIVSQQKDKVLLINQVEIEDYICSVLKTESWPGWPLEVNKAFAIASRSYVLSQVLSARKIKRPYHVKNSNHHQTYSGIHHDIDLRNAVIETKGMILGHKDEPILAMFDSCCGGIIPAHIEGFDFQSHPYLARTQKCNYCRLAKVYSWKLSYSNQEFQKILQSARPNLCAIKKLIINADKAGTVKNLVVHDHKNSYILDARTMYSLFKDIKSFSYSVSLQPKAVKVNGTGLGHHLGLCQWGAREMIRKGYTHRDILRFYYPGAKFMKFTDAKKTD